MENAHGSRFVVDSLSSPRSFYILIPRVSPFISFPLLSFLSCRPPGSFYARHPLLHVYIRFETPCVNGGREACGAQPPGYAFRSRNRTLLKILLSKRRGLLALLPFEERKKFEMAEIKLCARVRVCSNSASATFYNKLGKLRLPPLSLSLSGWPNRESFMARFRNEFVISPSSGRDLFDQSREPSEFYIGRFVRSVVNFSTTNF